MRIDKTTALRLVAMITATAYVTFVYKVPEFQLGPLPQLLWAFAVLFPVTLVLAALSEKESWVIAFFVVVGVGIGVMIDAATDQASRNLFPFEFLFLCVLLAPAVIAGTTLGWLIRKYRGKGVKQ